LNASNNRTNEFEATCLAFEQLKREYGQLNINHQQLTNLYDMVKKQLNGSKKDASDMKNQLDDL
jgi:uncharacterized protein YfkK (UPF0435 family)